MGALIKPQTSVQLIRELARELAGEFYEQKRSGKFRSPDSLTRAKMLKMMPDGTPIEIDVVVPFKTAYPSSKQFSKAHWPLFYEPARRCLVTMLAMPDSAVSPQHKEAIHEAIVEDRQRQFKHEAVKGPARSLIQRDIDR